MFILLFILFSGDGGTKNIDTDDLYNPIYYMLYYLRAKEETRMGSVHSQY